MVIKQQVVLVSSGIVLLALLFVFGRTVPPANDPQSPVSTLHNGNKFNIDTVLATAKANLTPAQQGYINALESSVVRGDVKNQQVHIYHQLATFWKDSVHSLEPYAFYTAEASKLENSEKTLTFAAQLFLDNVRQVSDPGVKTWMASQAKDLFKRSLQLNPTNDSAKIGLGSAYIFGSVANDPQEVMQGIQQLLEVARRDSANMYAQLMLGIGGMVSGQTGKAIERLLKVVSHEPDNLEAIFTLAEAYEQKGDKQLAIKWYEASRKRIANREVIKEIDQRIKLLK